MKRKTPDQIRRETVPAKYYGLIFGFLGGLAGALIWFGGWGLLHKEQARRYPEYVRHAVRAEMEGLALFGSPKRRDGLSAEALRYLLLRYGNQDHRFDAEIIRHGWYPRGANPKMWVFSNGNVKPVYSDDPSLVFKWPLTLTAFTLLTCLVWGLVKDYRNRAAIISGVPFDGSLVSTVDEYNTEVQGDGMSYVVKPWRDR